MLGEPQVNTTADFVINVCRCVQWLLGEWANSGQNHAVQKLAIKHNKNKKPMQSLKTQNDQNQFDSLKLLNMQTALLVCSEILAKDFNHGNKFLIINIISCLFSV